MKTTFINRRNKNEKVLERANDIVAVERYDMENRGEGNGTAARSKTKKANFWRNSMS